MIREGKAAPAVEPAGHGMMGAPIGVSEDTLNDEYRAEYRAKNRAWIGMIRVSGSNDLNIPLGKRCR